MNKEAAEKASRGTRKRSRDTASRRVVVTSTSQLRTDSLAHVAAAYASVDGYTVAREEKAQQRAAGVFIEGIQYGEVKAEAFARCLDWVEPVAGEIFFDLGSGTGKAVLTAAALHPFAAATGIEIQPR